MYYPGSQSQRREKENGERGVILRTCGINDYLKFDHDSINVCTKEGKYLIVNASQLGLCEGMLL